MAMSSAVAMSSEGTFGISNSGFSFAIIRAHHTSMAQKSKVEAAMTEIHAARELKTDIRMGKSEGATSLQIKSILTMTEFTPVRSYLRSDLIGPTKTGTQSLSSESLFPIAARSWIISKSRIVPNRKPFWRLEKGPPEGVVPSAETGQESQSRYCMTAAA